MRERPHLGAERHELSRHFVRRLVGLALCACVLTSAPARAQNWSFDARAIGMGGVGSTSNVAADMVNEQRPYRPIVLPFGLFQVIQNLPKLDPTSDEFDLVRAIEYAASPIHFIIGRDDTKTSSDFIADIRNGTLNRDLNTYRGFSPATSVSAEGLASPNWGHTFKFPSGDTGLFHGIYVGAGPYFSMKAAAALDPALAAVLASPTPVYIPNTSFYMSSDTESQFAMAITGGYRGRIPWTGGRSSRAPGSAFETVEGLYIGANYHYLHGFSYERFQPEARLDTNGQGILFVDLTKGFPVSIARTSSTSGTGFALDAGVAAVIDRWELGFGVNGIANRITWKGAERTSYVLDSLFSGGDFVDFPGGPIDDVRVELPIDVRVNGAYHADAWSGIVEYGHGYNGHTVRSGVERRFDGIQLRAGARYVNEQWEGTGGVGFDFSDRFGVDVAAFGTSANLERKRHMAIAVSLRLMRRGD